VIIEAYPEGRSRPRATRRYLSGLAFSHHSRPHAIVSVASGSRQRSAMKPGTDVSLTVPIRAALARAGNPTRAKGAQAYMKSTMPFHGVAVPEMRRLVRDIFDSHPIGMAADWRQAIGDLWDQATHREERYAAIELAAHPPYQRFISLAVLPLYRRMIQEGAWWDLVDGLAARVAVLLATYPDRLKPTLRAWARNDNIWLRRVAIIAQVSFRDATDSQLLWDAIAPSLGSSQFFLRKAIGWALREHAKARPDEVADYLARHGPELSPLSRREAMKGLAHFKRRGPTRQSSRRTR